MLFLIRKSNIELTIVCENYYHLWTQIIPQTV